MVEQSVTPEPASPYLFTSLTSEHTGIDFTNAIRENPSSNSVVYQYVYNGGGVAVGDIDNDGYQDLYFVANLGENKLYRNLGTNDTSNTHLQFKDITDQARVRGTTGWSTGVTMADVNADGWLDLYVCKSGNREASFRENLLFINNQNGTFTEAASDYGLNFSGYSTQAAFFDYDRDGDLDMYLLNHNIERINTNRPEDLKSKYNELSADILYQNMNGKFVDVSRKAGIIQNTIGFGLGVSISDLNQDGWPDIYIANDFFERDYMYINNRNGTFTESLLPRTKHISYFAMGSDAADINNDGWPDLMVLDMAAADNYRTKTSMSGMNPTNFNHFVKHGFHHQYMFNTLQLNQGGQHFSEIAQLAGVSKTDWSWAPLLADFDNDGWKDLFITNGLKRDDRNNDFQQYRIRRLKQAKQNNESMDAVLKDLIEKSPTRPAKNYFFSNNKDLTFTNQSNSWIESTPSFSNGAAYADLDNDGDLDLVINNIDEKASILQNNSDQNYLQVEFKGPKKNVFGVGAKVKLLYKNNQQTQENFPTRGYQSAVSPLLTFGMAAVETVDQLRVIWPDGKSQVMTNIKSNQRIVLQYGQAVTPMGETDQSTGRYLFNDITRKSQIQHNHQESIFNDFKRESLLPHKLSQLGPAIAVGDVNQDGLEDFFIGGAKGFIGALYMQKENHSFIKSKNDAWKGDQGFEDVAGAFFDADEDGDLDLYIVSGSNEYEVNDTRLQDRLYLNDGSGQFSKSGQALPTMLTSGACVSAMDYDQDGDLDLFVGGRQVPGKYPFPANSYVLNNQGGKFIDVTKTVAPDLVSPGMVTDAVWTDFNGDDYVDLIIVGEWMHISFYQNNNGKLNKIASPIVDQKDHMTGWWSSIASADLDGDGDLDYVVGNLGLNYKYHASPTAPFEIYCADFDESGSLDIVLGYYENGSLFPLRGRECSSNQMPFIKQKFPSYHDFGSANLTEVYGEEKLKQALHLNAQTFSSIILENINGQFKMHQLPNEAQLSSINGILIRDFNGDGHEDIIVAGNMHQAEVETPRNDASVGLFLKGNGNMSFEAVPPFRSNLFLDGDVKGLKLISLSGSDQPGILVANNNAAVQLIEVK
jgi:hypothetical protein